MFKVALRRWTGQTDGDLSVSLAETIDALSAVTTIRR